MKPFHKQYWIGYQVPPTDAWPNFTQVDRTTPASSYRHWGMALLGNRSEPDNRAGNENCAAANSTLEYGGAWGWSDASCGMALPFMCRLLRRWRRTKSLERISMLMMVPVHTAALGGSLQHACAALLHACLPV
jgi:hypothetical protein